MNNIMIIGRMVREPEVKYTASTQKAVCRFTLACDNGKDQNGNKKDADFIPCIAWDKKAETIGTYLKKGRMFAVKGKLQSGSYTDSNGEKHSTLNVLVQEMQFLDYGERKEQVEHQESIECGFEAVDESDSVPF